MWMHLLSSHLRVAFCIPQCVLVQTSVKLFKVCSTDVDVAGSSVGTVIRLIRSRFNVWKVWDQHRFKQICRNVAWFSEIVHQLQAHFYEIPKYCFNTPNGTETMTVSMLPTEKKNCFLASQDWQYFNSHKLEAHSKSQYTVYNRGPRGTANAQAFFLLVDQVPLCVCRRTCVVGKLPCNVLAFVWALAQTDC